MKKRSRYFKVLCLGLPFLFVLFAITSCEKQYINFGSGFIDNSITNLILVDTSTVEISTIYVDSFVTANTNTILAGKFKDENFGTVNAQSFLQVGLPLSTNYDVPNGSVFDSLEVILKLNKSYYGDTTSPYTIAVHQLLEPITFASQQQYTFFNNQTRAYSAAPLGSNQVMVKPFTRDTIAVTLPSSLGKDLFNKMQTKDAALQTLPEFLAYFKGLAITGVSGNNLIVGFSDSIKMRLHYHKPDVIVTKTYIDFGINQVNYQFNNISVNRSGTPIASLSSTNRQIPSTATQNAGFSQYITGAVTKIRFPYISNLFELPNFIKIIKAQLIIKPLPGSFAGLYSLPKYLRLSTTDQTNLLGGDLSAPGNTGQSAVQYGNLFIDNLYGTQTAYTYDVTNYLQAQLATTTTNKNGLLVLPPNQSVNFNRILIANGLNTNFKTQVKIYYASVK